MAAMVKKVLRYSPRTEHGVLFLGRLSETELRPEYMLAGSDTYDPGGSGLLRLALRRAETSLYV